MKSLSYMPIVNNTKISVVGKPVAILAPREGMEFIVVIEASNQNWTCYTGMFPDGSEFVGAVMGPYGPICLYRGRQVKG